MIENKNNTVFKNIKITKKIGEGAFGQIYQGIKKQKNFQVAIKIIGKNQKKEGYLAHQQLQHQSKIYKRLNGTRILFQIDGFPQFIQYGKINNYSAGPFNNYLIYGKNVKISGRKFSIKTICMIANQLISRLQFIHRKGIIHRDLKPDNFLIGLNKKSHIIYLIDFGMAKNYINNQGFHLSFTQNKGIVGTSKFCSISSHCRNQQSRKDDLQSLGYNLIFLANKKLPWQQIKNSNKQIQFSEVGMRKMATSLQQLCEFLPSEFYQYMFYVKNLEFDQDPNYDYLRNLFNEVLHKNGQKFDLYFDWRFIQKKIGLIFTT